MKLELKCDKCGKIGDSNEIKSNYDGKDFCERCGIEQKLEELKDQYDRKKKWLDETHLRELVLLKKEIHHLEEIVNNMEI